MQRSVYELRGTSEQAKTSIIAKGTLPPQSINLWHFYLFTLLLNSLSRDVYGFLAGRISPTAGAERSSMQNGSLIETKRRSGQSVWEFRWRDRTSGKAVYRRIVVGTTQKIATKDEARGIVEGIVFEINSGDPRLRTRVLEAKRTALESIVKKVTNGVAGQTEDSRSAVGAKTVGYPHEALGYRNGRGEKADYVLDCPESPTDLALRIRIS